MTVSGLLGPKGPSMPGRHPAPAQLRLLLGTQLVEPVTILIQPRTFPPQLPEQGRASLVLLGHAHPGCGEKGGRHVPFMCLLSPMKEQVNWSPYSLRDFHEHCMTDTQGYPQQGESLAGTGLAYPQQAALATGDHRDGPKACRLLTEVARATGRQQGRLFARGQEAMGVTDKFCH